VYDRPIPLRRASQGDFDLAEDVFGIL